MKKARILPLLGPAVVLYLVADLAAASGHPFSAAAVSVAVAALVLSLTPLFVRRRESRSGERRTALLGVAGAIALVGLIAPTVWSLAVDVAVAVAAVVAGATLLELALSVPDRPRVWEHRLLRLLVTALAIATGAAGVLACLPAFPVAGEMILVPARWAWLPAIYAAAAAVVALGLRLSRRWLGSSSVALAENRWATLALIPAGIIGVAAIVAVLALDVPAASPWIGGGVALALIAVVVGHALMVDPNRRLASGPATRQVWAAAIAMGGVAAGIGLLADRLPHEGATLALLSAATLLAALALYRLAFPLMRFLFSPFGSRLVDALREAEQLLLATEGFLELGRDVLGALRRGSGSSDAAPRIYVVLPPMTLGIDAAGEPHVEHQGMAPVLHDWLSRPDATMLVRAELRRQTVRRPEVRLLVQHLDDLDALAVVPLSRDGELEGALVLSRGRRSSPLSLEEIHLIHLFASKLCRTLVVLAAEARAQLRAAEAIRDQDRLRERVTELEAELLRVSRDAQELLSGRARPTTPTVIAYSPAMRQVVNRADEVGPLEVTVWIHGDPDAGVEALARRIHGSGGRATMPFVVGDCLTVAASGARAARVGDEESNPPRPGWLRLAAGGTLLLLDAVALSREVQGELAQTLATRRAYPNGEGPAYALTARVIVATRMDVMKLAAMGSFDSDLADRLSALCLALPALGDRREDIESLSLLAIDKACRARGRDILGLEREALEHLVSRDWPGDVAELERIIDSAVAIAAGDKIGIADLASTAPETDTDGREAAAASALSGTYASLEQRILVDALSRADGNKSEAARLLGLKRTTFLDKLKRHDLLVERKTGSESAA